MKFWRKKHRMERKLDFAFTLECRLLKWTKTVPVGSTFHFPMKGEKKVIYKNVLSVGVCCVTECHYSNFNSYVLSVRQSMLIFILFVVVVKHGKGEYLKTG